MDLIGPYLLTRILIRKMYIGGLKDTVYSNCMNAIKEDIGFNFSP